MRSDTPGHLGDRYGHRPVPHPEVPPDQRPSGFRCARCLAPLKAHAEGVWLIWTDENGGRTCLETRVTVTRPVAVDEPHNYLGSAALPGETFWTFAGPTYGSCDERRGIVLSERRGENPFFEFPRDAVQPVTGDQPSPPAAPPVMTARATVWAWLTINPGQTAQEIARAALGERPAATGSHVNDHAARGLLGRMERDSQVSSRKTYRAQQGRDVTLWYAVPGVFAVTMKVVHVAGDGSFADLTIRVSDRHA